MSGSINKTIVKSNRSAIKTPLVNFTLDTEPGFGLTNFNVGSIGSYQPVVLDPNRNRSIKEIVEQYEVNTKLICKICRSLAVKNLIWEGLFDDPVLEALEKDAWVVLNKGPIGGSIKGLRIALLYKDITKVDVKGVSTNDLIGRTSATSSKKIYDNINKDVEEKVETDKDLDALNPEGVVNVDFDGAVNRLDAMRARVRDVAGGGFAGRVVFEPEGNGWREIFAVPRNPEPPATALEIRIDPVTLNEVRIATNVDEFRNRLNLFSQNHEFNDAIRPEGWVKASGNELLEWSVPLQMWQRA